MLTKDTACDVLVAGGGVSGVVSAVASAGSGASTVLIEKENVLGGVGFSGMLQYICGLYLNGDSIPTKTINQGIVSEVVRFLNELSPQRRVTRMGRVFVLPYSRFDLQYVLGSLCAGESNLEILLNTTAISILKKKDKIHQVSVYNSGNLRSIFPKVVIDCTGNGDISVMAGAEYELSSSDWQLAGYTVRFKGLDNQDELLAVKVPYHLAEAVQEKLLPPAFKFSNYTPGDALDEGYCKFSIDGFPGAEREFSAQEAALAAHRYLANKLLAFKDSYISESSIGVIDRESRRISGEYTLIEKDVISGRKFDDGVVRNSWPIEIWDKGKGTVYKYVKSSDYYEIPFRCLKVKHIPNLLCAGRIISVSHEAYASTRVMGTCMALGEQAGLAATRWINDGSYTDVKKQ